MTSGKRQVRVYTAIGRRIAALGQRQADIARVLGVAQQTVSKKLRGKTAIFLSDLQRLAENYGVPLTYFFEEGKGNPRLAAAIERIHANPGPHQELVILASELPLPRAERLLQIARLTFASPGSRTLGR